MTRALIFGPEEEALVASLVASAAAQPVPYAEMVQWGEAHAKGFHQSEPLRALNSALTIDLPVGYRCTYTHEERKPGVMCRHLSVSVDSAVGKGPNPLAFAEIMKLFGFKNALGHMPTWTERLPEGHFAVNAVEPLDGDVGKLAK